MNKKEIQEKVKIDDEQLARVTRGTQGENASENAGVEDDPVYL